MRALYFRERDDCDSASALDAMLWLMLSRMALKSPRCELVLQCVRVYVLDGGGE